MPNESNTAVCSVDRCERSIQARGYCNGHYQRFWKGKPVDGPLRGDSVMQRLEAQIDKTGDCWIWNGHRNPSNYGRVQYRGVQTRLVHRLVYELTVGPIPEDLVLDHRCRNPPCVNPAHLEPVTHRTNILRGIGPSAVNARKTHCYRGHEFTEANTYVIPSTGGRQCRACVRIYRENKRSMR